MEQPSGLPLELLITAISALDSLPDYIRAMIAGLLLVVFLRFFESKIPEREVLFSESFRKTAFVALLTIPLFVWLFPSSRMVVFVEELPAVVTAANRGWLMLPGIWAVGCAYSLVVLSHNYLQAITRFNALPPIEEDDKLLPRLNHWQRRLGVVQPVTLVWIDGQQPSRLVGSRRIGFPRAAAHWPPAIQDILIIEQLSHLKKHHGPWHLLAQLADCCYWPVPWLTGLHARLLGNFQLAADELSESCYHDSLGYDRALRQLQQRLENPLTERRKPATAPNTRWRRLTLRLRNQIAGMARLLTPWPELYWDIENQLSWRERRTDLLRVEPYERVILFVGQAVFLAILFTGVTLKETPPEIEREYAIPAEYFWMENFHRNLERIEQQGYSATDEEQLIRAVRAHAARQAGG